jgi:hypothetical protein
MGKKYASSNKDDRYLEVLSYGMDLELAFLLGRLFNEEYSLKQGYISKNEYKHRIKEVIKRSKEKILKLLALVKEDYLTANPNFENSKLVEYVKRKKKEIESIGFDLRKRPSQKISMKDVLKEMDELLKE